jgi:hypothetical protein
MDRLLYVADVDRMTTSSLKSTYVDFQKLINLDTAKPLIKKRAIGALSF